MSRSTTTRTRTREAAAAARAGRARPSQVPGRVVLASGVWLLGGWWLLGYEEAQRAVTVDVVAGIALVALASLRLLAWSASRGVPLLVMGTGLLLVIAPVVLRYGYVDRVVAAYVNDIVVGLVVLAAGFWLSRQGPHASATTAPVRRT